MDTPKWALIMSIRSSWGTGQARLFMCAADVTEVLMAIFAAMEAGDVDEARRIQNLLVPLSYLKSYVRGQYDNKMTLHRRGLFDHPRASPCRHGITGWRS